MRWNTEREELKCRVCRRVTQYWDNVWLLFIFKFWNASIIEAIELIFVWAPNQPPEGRQQKILLFTARVQKEKIVVRLFCNFNMHQRDERPLIIILDTDN